MNRLIIAVGGLLIAAVFVAGYVVAQVSSDPTLNASSSDTVLDVIDSGSSAAPDDELLAPPPSDDAMPIGPDEHLPPLQLFGPEEPIPAGNDTAWSTIWAPSPDWATHRQVFVRPAGSVDPEPSSRDVIVDWAVKFIGPGGEVMYVSQARPAGGFWSHVSPNPKAEALDDGRQILSAPSFTSSTGATGLYTLVTHGRTMVSVSGSGSMSELRRYVDELVGVDVAYD